MAKDNFWKNPAARRGLLRISDRFSTSKYANGIPDGPTLLALGELLKSSKTKAMLKPAGVKYPSELDLDLLAKGNKESWNHFDTGTVADDLYTMSATKWGTLDSFKNRLIGLAKYDPELAKIIFNGDGSVNQANVDRISKVAYAKLGNDSIFDYFNNDPEIYYINPKMSEDEAGFRAEAFEENLGDTPEYLNDDLNYSGALLTLDERVKQEYKDRQQKQQQLQNVLKAAKANSLANKSNDIEATIGGDPVSVLPSYVQASMNPPKDSEDEKLEQLLKLKSDRDSKIDDLVKYAVDDFNANKKNLAWWL